MHACEILDYRIINGYIMKTNVLKKVVLMLLCVVSASVTVLGKDLVSNVLPIADPYILFYNGMYYA